MSFHSEKFSGYSFNDNGTVSKDGVDLVPEQRNYHPDSQTFRMKFTVCADSLIFTKEHGWKMQDSSYRYQIYESIEFYYFDIINGVVHYYFVTCTEE